MPKMLTVALLRKHTELLWTFRRVSDLEGEPVTGRFRWVGREEYLSMAPANPPGAAAWPREEFAQRFAEWFDALPADAQEARTQRARDLLYRVAAATGLEPNFQLEAKRLEDEAADEAKRTGAKAPRPTPTAVELARQLGSDAEEAAVEVLFASGILQRPAAVAPVAPAESTETKTEETAAELRDAA